jgi:hypothetical protein
MLYQPIFLISMLDGGEWWWVVSFTPRPLYRRGETSDANWIGGWVGTRAGMDAVEKRKISCRCRELNADSSEALAIASIKEYLMTCNEAVRQMGKSESKRKDNLTINPRH